MTSRETLARWQVIAVLFLLSSLTIVDRVCISAAKIDMSRDLGISDLTFGWVFGVFALGYAILQVPSGWLADRLGPRKFLAVIVLLWSLFTGLTGLVQGSVALIAVRFLFGLAEAGSYPGASRAFYNWLPAHERGAAQGILFAGSRLGAAFGLAVMSLSVAAFGWRASFLLLFVAGLTWAAFWFLWFRDHPPGKGVPGREPAAKLDWRGMLVSRNVQLLLVQYFASNFTFFLCFSWLLPYLKDQYKLTTGEAGMYASVPLYFGAVANWASGLTVDFLYRRGHRRLSRLLPAMLGFALAIVSLIAATFMPTVGGAVICFALATFGVDLTLSPSWTMCMDIGGKHTGTLSGAMNMAGNIGSFVSSLTFPYLLSLTGSASTYFYVAALINLVALSCWWRVRPIGEQT